MPFKLIAKLVSKLVPPAANISFTITFPVPFPVKVKLPLVVLDEILSQENVPVQGVFPDKVLFAKLWIPFK